MAIEIIDDTAGLLNPAEFECIVAEVAEYVPAVQHIKETVRAGKDLRVLVRDLVSAVWLQRFADTYSYTVVRYQKTSAREVLSQRWHTRIPEQISDQAILDSGFLQANIVPRSDQSYEDIVLEHYWGEFFTFVAFPWSIAGDLIDSLDPERWQANRRLPLVMQALEARRTRWLTQATREQRQFIQSLFQEPQTLKERVERFRLVREYPAALGQGVLGKWFNLFRSLSLDPSAVRLTGLPVEDTVQEIRYYLNSIASSISGLADLEAALNQMSGALREEFEWLREQIQQKPAVLQPTVHFLQQVSKRFSPIHDEISVAMETLRGMIPPPYPSDPSGNQTPEDWLNWAIGEYLDYRFWLEESDGWDNAIAGYSAQYADWFYQNYTDLKYQYQHRWVFDLLNQAGLCLQQGRKVLFILVDGLNFKYVRNLLAHFGRHGFHPDGEIEPVWAVIPTTTEVSKHCLVAGRPDFRDVQGHSYEDILEKDWRAYFQGRQILYLPKLNALKDLRQFDADLILLNYLPIDDVQHRDEEQIATTHAAEIKGYIRSLVETVCQFARQSKVEDDLTIIIASDHGATKIPPDVENPVDDEFYRKRAKNPHHRYIVVPEERAANPTDYDQTNCYVLSAKAYGTRESYLIPKGYGRFIKVGGSIYVHGGLTPEETIVPFCRLVRADVQVLQPTIRLPKGVIRYSVKAVLTFIVGNPNDQDLAQVELNVAESDLPGVVVESIPPGKTVKVEVPVRIKRLPGAQGLDAITVRGAFEYRDQHHTIESVRLPVEARSLEESKTELDFDLDL